MNSSDILKIHDCLSEKDRAGLSAMQIAQEINVPGGDIEKYVSKFSKSFVRVGESSKYTLNRFSSPNNSRKVLLAEIRKAKNERAFIYFCFSVLVGCMAFGSR